MTEDAYDLGLILMTWLASTRLSIFEADGRLP